MKTLMPVVAIILVLLCVSTASASWTYVVPVRATMVYSYWPVGPVYAYPRPAVVAPPVVVPAPVTYADPTVAPAVVVFPRGYVSGRPVRNVFRVVTP